MKASYKLIKPHLLPLPQFKHTFVLISPLNHLFNLPLFHHAVLNSLLQSHEIGRWETEMFLRNTPARSHSEIVKKK